MNDNVAFIKAFTKNPKQGNPAGVLLEANSTSDEKKQAIATELGFSESAFVEQSDIANFKVRFFSPTQEVDFCGHATVATFYTLLAAQKIKPTKTEPLVVTQETGIGVLPVTCYEDGKIMMTQQKPEFAEIFTDRAQFAHMIGINPKDLGDQPIQIVSTGSRQLVIPVNNLEILKTIQPNKDEIIEHSIRYDHAGVCAVTAEGFTASGDLATRNFAPKYGIDEDPATGIAAGLLGWYGDMYFFNQQKKHLTIEQGFAMDAASTIFVDITDGTLVGGYACEFKNM